MIGMLSVLLLSALLPWRAVSCAALGAPFGATDEPAFQIICKADTAAGHSELAALPGEPAPEHPDCPICFGLAGLSFVITALVILGDAPRRLSHTLQIPASLWVQGVERLLRSSRAPPLAA